MENKKYTNVNSNSEKKAVYCRKIHISDDSGVLYTYTSIYERFCSKS